MVSVSDKEVAPEVKRWGNALIGYVLGQDLQFMAMKRFVDSEWRRTYGNARFYIIEPGVLMFDFETAESKQLVLDQCLFGLNCLI